MDSYVCAILFVWKERITICKRHVRVILKTVRPMVSDYRVRSILVNEDDVLLAYDNVHNRNIEGIEAYGEFFIKHPS